MAKRKFEQHFYVGEIIQDTNEEQWKVLSAEFIRFYDADYPNWDRWEYTLQLIDSEFQDDVGISRTQWNPYTLIQPSEARLWKK